MVSIATLPPRQRGGMNIGQTLLQIMQMKRLKQAEAEAIADRQLKIQGLQQKATEFALSLSKEHDTRIRNNVTSFINNRLANVVTWDDYSDAYDAAGGGKKLGNLLPHPNELRRVDPNKFHEAIRSIRLGKKQAEMEYGAEIEKGKPKTREIKRGDNIITQEKRNGKWVDIATAPRWSPKEGMSEADIEKERIAPLVTKHSTVRSELDKILKRNQISGFRLDEWMMLATPEQRKTYLQERQGNVLEKLSGDDRKRFQDMTKQMERLTDEILGLGEKKEIRVPFPPPTEENVVSLGDYEGKEVIKYTDQSGVTRIGYADNVLKVGGVIQQEGWADANNILKVGGEIPPPSEATGKKQVPRFVYGGLLKKYPREVVEALYEIMD